MKTTFPKIQAHIPYRYVLDAKNQCLGRLATKASQLLRGKETCYYTPGVDQGNIVVILNADQVKVTGQKRWEKFYYRNSQRPGSLKKESFDQLQNRIPSRILEKAIWGMLSKNHLGRQHYRRLYIYSQGKIPFTTSENNEKDYWIYLNQNN
jgi:large subunit ribosomal protein L13